MSSGDIEESKTSSGVTSSSVSAYSNAVDFPLDLVIGLVLEVVPGITFENM